MGVKPKKRKRSVKARIVIQTEEETVVDKMVGVNYPLDGSPYSTVGVTLGMRCSKPGTYSSATCEIHVSLPCTPGEEEEAGEVALEKAQNIYEAYSDDFERTIDNL